LLFLTWLVTLIDFGQELILVKMTIFW